MVFDGSTGYGVYAIVEMIIAENDVFARWHAARRKTAGCRRSAGATGINMACIARLNGGPFAHACAAWMWTASDVATTDALIIAQALGMFGSFDRKASP